MFTLPVILSLFLLLFIAGVIYSISTKFPQVPYTVLLVVCGIGVGVLGLIPELHFLTAFKLTPELLFYIFLPILIFEAAYNVHIKNFYQSFFSISLLSTLGLFISTAFIGIGTHLIFGYMGINIPLLITLLFGAIISATDPVSVLALFKSLGAPKRLSLIFEGESLFNDATAVALFVAILGMIQSPIGVSTDSIISASYLFITMIVSGVIFGALMGKVFSFILKHVKHNEMATLSFMLVMAHLTFLLSELANEFLVSHKIIFALSPIIATTIASMKLGNEGGLLLPPAVKKFSHRFWTQTTFFANSIVFLLVGILIVEQNIFSAELLVPVIIGVVFVFLARIISVYPLLGFINYLKIEEKIPQSWQILMSWASIRGALSIIIVLTIPENLAISGWPFEASVKDMIVALTLGSVVASLVGKSLTIPWLLKKLGILKLNEEEKLVLSETQRFMNILKKRKLAHAFEKGYVNDESYHVLNESLQNNISQCTLGAPVTFHSVINHYALSVEKYYLKELYGRGEVSESLYLRILKKIDGQESFLDGKVRGKIFLSEKVFMKLYERRKRQGKKSIRNKSPLDQYLYYRALAIIARKVVKDILNKDFPEYYSDQVQFVIEKYTHYQHRNQEKMKDLEISHHQDISPVLIVLGNHMLHDYEERVIDELIHTDFTSERVAAHLGK